MASLPFIVFDLVVSIEIVASVGKVSGVSTVGKVGAGFVVYIF